MKRAIGILLLLSVLALQSYPQKYDGLNYAPQPRVDSILSLMNPYISDSLRATLYLNIARNLYNTDSAIRFCNLALEKCRPTDTLLRAMTYHVMGWRYHQKHEIYTSVQYLRMAYNLYDPDRNYEGKNICSVVLAQGFELLHLADSAFYYLNKSLENSIMRNDTAQIATTYLNLGRICITLNLYDNAEEYITKSVLLDSLSGNTLDMACGYYWLGYLYIHMQAYPKTGRYLRSAIRVFRSHGYLRSYYAMNLHLAYSYMADTYISSAERSGQTRFADSCLVYISKGGDFFLENGQYANYMIARYAYVKYLIFYKKYKEALDVLVECEKYMKSPDLRRDYHGYLTLVYKKLGKFEDALTHQQLHYEYAMQYLNDSSLTALADSKTHQALLHKEAEQRQNDRLHNEQTQRMRVVIVSLISGLLMASLLLVFIIRILKIKKRANEQLNMVHTAVTDSMHYSERIQRAVIPSDEFIKSLFPESFVYYRPRDIVSGDFYYALKCGRYNVFVVSDCTGHGIPGGFLSMLGISSLKEYLITETDAANPGTVLDRMRTFFKETLGSTDSLMPMYDGMDIIIASFDLENQTLVYASANLRGYIVRNGEVIKLQGDKMPVGRYFIEKEHFDSYTVQLQSGDMVYLCTDGIQDQTGGADPDHTFGKKFMSANLIKVLTDMSPLTVDKQLVTIDGVVTDWRGAFDQIDDITLVGIRI